MVRIKACFLLVAILAFWLPQSGCVRMKLVSVDEKTQLENQILGSFEQLQQDLVLVASVRDENGKTPEIPEAKREALVAMMNRQFNLDDVNQLKRDNVAGENNKGLLTFFATDRTRANAEYLAFAKRIIKEENRDRFVIMQRLISTTPSLTKADLPLIRQIFYTLNEAGSAPGTRIQTPDGEWTVKADMAE